VRLGDRLQIRVETGDAADCLVPPLLLQPIVENAVTHGIAHMLGGGLVSVVAAASPLTLTVRVENPADRDRPRKTGTGLGLANVRARLRALYGSDASIRWEESDGRWTVEVVLPAVRERT
jgi:LytS/YehU family sensor histidine kinase